MNVEREDFESGWCDIRLALSHDEIDALIGLLQSIKGNPDQHFHFGSKWQDESRVSDIEFNVKGEGEPDNMSILGLPIAPNR